MGGQNINFFLNSEIIHHNMKVLFWLMQLEVCSNGFLSIAMLGNLDEVSKNFIP